MTASARDVAAAVRRRMLDAAVADPSVRGADWRLATVDTVGSDGTVTTTDGIVARRLATYLDPTSGDLVVITASGIGSWLAIGPLGTGTGSAWTSYAAAWSASGTAPSLGNGTLSSAYTLRGDECHVSIRQVMGSTTTYGTGQFRWSLPFTAATLPNAAMFWTGSAMAGDAGTAYYPGICRLLSGSNLVMCINPATATGSSTTEWNASRPHTWGSGDYLGLDLVYQIA
ncbi:hypothetical protein AB0K23_01605 [Streptomyces sp. NPDC049602]|uniref:hypothetical protein n=1 Tax=Streptomyces sp. NPDC049602 TaxID=3155504 RepID=UPI003430D6A2